MFPVLYEYADSWPAEGPLLIKAQFIEEITVKPDYARRTANAYLGLDVSMALRASNPMLMLGGERPLWRLFIDLHWYKQGKIATLGTIDVDALNDTVIPLSTQEIENLRNKANDIIGRFAPTSETRI
jgi:hypothetical protein